MGHTTRFCISGSNYLCQRGWHGFCGERINKERIKPGLQILLPGVCAKYETFVQGFASSSIFPYGYSRNGGWYFTEG